MGGKYPQEEESKQRALVGLEAAGHTGHGDKPTSGMSARGKSIDPVCEEIKVAQKRSSSAYHL